jgi:hypothetical protein
MAIKTTSSTIVSADDPAISNLISNQLTGVQSGIFNVTSTNASTTAIVDVNSTDSTNIPTTNITFNTASNNSVILAGITTSEINTAVLNSASVFNTDKEIYVTGIDQRTVNQITYGTSTYNLPIASDAILGGIRIGTGLYIEPISGVLSVDIDPNITYQISSQVGPVAPGGITSANLELQGSDSTVDTVKFVGDQYVNVTSSNTQTIQLTYSGPLGTVTSVALSGASTGLTFSGSPITSNGTITLGGTLSVSNGGTGGTTASTALSNLLPTQSGNTGKFLTTNGSVASWGTVAADLSIAGNSGTGSVNISSQSLNILGSSGISTSTSGQTVTVSAAPALASIAQLTTVADQTIYTTASNTYATTTLTPYIRTLLDDSSSTDARITLGVEIGVNVQGYDAGLQALADKTSTGILSQTSTNTYTSRSIVGPAEGIVITDGDGINGNPTISLANDLAAVEDLTGTGYAIRTGNSTWSTRTIEGTSDRITVNNGSGAAANTIIDLSSVSQTNSGSFVKVNVDSYGRVIGNTAVTSLDISAIVDSVYLRLNGSNSMTANLNMGTSYKIINLAEPTVGSDAATKNYVDNSIVGLSWKVAAQALSFTNVPLSGSTPLVIDSRTALNNDRILLLGQTTTSNNGIYTLTITGGTYTLARSTDADTFSELNYAAIFVQFGTLYANTAWTQTTILGSFSGQNWVQFSGSTAYSGGTAINISGTVVNVKVGTGLKTDVSNNLQLSVNSDIALNTTGPGNSLTLSLDGTSLTQSALGIKINTAGVTNSMLANSSLNFVADSGTGTISLGQTLTVNGNATQGISTSVSGSTFTVTASNATTTQKGVASFNTASFAVTSGNVTIKSGGVSNAQLQNSSITLNGNTGTDAVSLGETLLITGSGAITTNSNANTLTVSVANATTTTVGVASFDTNDFTVSAGAVSLKPISVTKGGTGLSAVTAGRILYGAGTSPIATSAAFTFDGTSTLTVGSLIIDGSFSKKITSTTTTIESTASNANVLLALNGTGKVQVSGVTASNYANNLDDNSLVNKYYVQNLSVIDGGTY